MMKLRLLIRPVAVILFLIHLVLRFIFKDPNVWIDLILFNLIGVLASVIALISPVFTDRKAAYAIGYSQLIWSFGSIFSSWNSFFQAQLPSALSDFCYSIFYPLIFFGVVRSFTSRLKTSALEILDTAIIAIGFTSVLTAFFLKPAMLTFQGSAFSVFLSIIYPVGDIVILATALVYLILNPISKRTVILCLGLLSFAISDLLFLWLSINNRYQFGSINDDGWILGLLLISLSLFYTSGEAKNYEQVSSYAATIALIASGTLLGIAAIKPGYFPTFVLIPGFLTIALAFVRMSFALQEANSAGTERLLARTDELTGLANRRNFLTKLAEMKSGFIFLLDLDGFKFINDTYGHEAGDQLLRQVAGRFMRVLPNDCHLARLGGDEFGILMDGAADEAFELGQAIRATLSYPIALTSDSAKVDVSIGITKFNPELTASELLHQADQMMYEAKRSKSGVMIWSQ